MRIGIIGNGWRAKQFLRIIEELPELFHLTGVLFRNPEKAKHFTEETGLPAFTELETFVRTDPDFILLLIPRSEVLSYCEPLFQKGIPVLTETPPCNGMEELSKAWELKQKYHGKIQIAEQYHLQPYHQAVLSLVQDGVLGEVHSVCASVAHDYHNISIIRKLLGISYETCTIRAKKYVIPVTQTCGRDGMLEQQTVTTDSFRKLATFEFGNGKFAQYDFCREQYFNYLRSRHLQVQGTRGELFDTTVRYLTQDGIPVTTELTRVDTGVYSNLEGYYHRGILFQDRFVSQSPFAAHTHARLNDDEIAMGACLVKMMRFVADGTPFYPLEEALQDTYLSLLTDLSADTGTEVVSVPQPWYQSNVKGF